VGDMGDDFRALKEAQRELRSRLGIDCPGCPKVQPKRIPTVLLPQQRCKVCGYRDPRPRTPDSSIWKPAAIRSLIPPQEK
jgi:hypothetical protein